MSFYEIREKFSPLIKSLKSEGDKLRAEFAKVHADYMTTASALQALEKAPPHRSELEEVLRQALERVATARLEKFAEYSAWRNSPESARLEYGNQRFIEGFANSPVALEALLAVQLRENLPVIVQKLPWTDDVLDPGARKERRAKLEPQLKALLARLEELHTIAAEVNIQLRVE